MKQKCYSPFWGVVGIKKWSPFLDSGAQSPIFWHLKTGTFAESARFQVPKNGISDHETEKRRPLFNANIPPKWWITCLFHSFITFGWVLSQFLKFGSFGAVFGPYLSKITGPKLQNTYRHYIILYRM